MTDAEREQAKQQIVRLIAAGNTVTIACQASGIRSRDTYYRWRDEDPAFGAQVDKAKGAAAARNVTIVTVAARQDWRAAAWWLERNYPDDYALKRRLEHTGPGGGPIQTEEAKSIKDLLSVMTAEELEAMEESQRIMEAASARLDQRADQGGTVSS